MSRFKIDGPLADVATRIAVEGIPFPEFQLPAVVSVRWLDGDLLKPEIALLPSGALSLRCLARGVADLRAFQGGGRPKMEIRTLSGTLAAGTVLRESLNVSSDRPAAITFHLHEWKWSAAERPAAWIVRVPGAQWHRGNAFLRLARGTKRHQVAVFAFYEEDLRCALVKPHDQIGARKIDGPQVLVLSGDNLDRTRAMEALRTIEFCLGCRFAPESPLLGVNTEMRVVSAESLDMQPARRVSRTRPPIPDSLAVRHLHHQPLFAALTREISARGDGLIVLALVPYLDALSGHLDGAYLQAQIALEAFCSAARTGAAPGLLVADAKKWLAFVQGIASSAEAHAANEESKKRLVNKLNSAMHAPSTEAVEAYFTEKGVALTAEALTEIKARNSAAHNLLMTKGPNRNMRQDLMRVERVQALLASALALHVGYAGPIAAPGSREHAPDWWPTRVTAEPEDILLESSVAPVGRVPFRERVGHRWTRVRQALRQVARALRSARPDDE